MVVMSYDGGMVKDEGSNSDERWWWYGDMSGGVMVMGYR